jgi:hypothetical protein
VLSTQVEVGGPTGAGVGVVTGAGVEVVTGAGVGVDAVHCLQDSGQFVFPIALLLHLAHVFFLANLGV